MRLGVCGCRELRASLGKKARLLRLVGECLERRDLNTNESSVNGGASWKAFVSPEAMRRTQRNRVLRGKFKQAALSLEEEFRGLVEASRLRGSSRIWAFLKVVVGCIASLLSLLLIVHVVLFFFVPQWTGIPAFGFLRFLDYALEVSTSLFLLFSIYFHSSTFLFTLFTLHHISLMQAMAKRGAALAALALYAVFAVYLLACVMKGCVAVGMKVREKEFSED